MRDRLRNGVPVPRLPCGADSIYRLNCSMVARAPAADIFRVFEGPRNLSKMTPRGLISESSIRRARHRHTFAEMAAGVAIGDQVDYRLPLGVLGRIAHAAVVKRQLISIFRYRRREIAKLLKVPGIRFDEPSIVYL
jgi:hypothetical protein